MKILILLPDGRVHKIKLGNFSKSFREAPLTATMLAALVPSELNAEITICDESIDQIPFHKSFDIVAISALTGTANRAYELAAYFRNKKSTVVLGGFHVTLLPDEAKNHADTIVIGFAEETWPQLLLDYSKGQLKPMYKSDHQVPIQNLPLPRRDLQKNMRYGVPNAIFATRGCRSVCEFCSIPAASVGWQTRPVNQVIDELKTFKTKRVAFNDVNLTDDTEYAKELLTAMIPLKKTWGGLASSQILKDEELLDLLPKSGCSFLLLGFESVNTQSLNNIYKGFNKNKEYEAQVIHELHKRKIVIQGCFIFGMESDTKDIFAETVDFVNEQKIDIPRYAIFTPYPKTKAFDRLEAENRLLHKNWYYYDTQHVVFQPKNLSPAELDEGFKWAYRETFKINAIFNRTKGSGANFPIAFAGNLAYNRYARRLAKDSNRFPK